MCALCCLTIYVLFFTHIEINYQFHFKLLPWPFFLCVVYDKTIHVIRFSFCDIQNYQGLHKGYQPQPLASSDNPYLNIDYHGYQKKPSYSNCLKNDKAAGQSSVHS